MKFININLGKTHLIIPITPNISFVGLQTESLFFLEIFGIILVFLYCAVPCIHFTHYLQMIWSWFDPSQLFLRTRLWSVYQTHPGFADDIKRIIEIFDLARKLQEKNLDLLNDKENQFLNKTIMTRNIPTPKIIIKDHK